MPPIHPAREPYFILFSDTCWTVDIFKSASNETNVSGMFTEKSSFQNLSYMEPLLDAMGNPKRIELIIMTVILMLIIFALFIILNKDLFMISISGSSGIYILCILLKNLTYDLLN